MSGVGRFTVSGNIIGTKIWLARLAKYRLWTIFPVV